MMKKMNKSEKDWKKDLSPQQYHVLREKGTDPPFSGKYVKEDREGVYRCAACGNPLFSSKTKFKSGSGWPSFYEALSEDSVEKIPDNSQGMRRIEVVCKRCGSHLGHVFDDGPKPTKKRYCINSTSLELEEKEKAP